MRNPHILPDFLNRFLNLIKFRCKVELRRWLRHRGIGGREKCSDVRLALVVYLLFLRWRRADQRGAMNKGLKVRRKKTTCGMINWKRGETGGFGEDQVLELFVKVFVSDELFVLCQYVCFRTGYY